MLASAGERQGRRARRTVIARQRGSQRSGFTTAGILLGLGLGGFFDGIVLHQLLQWHHLVSNVARYPVTTVAGLEVNMLGDGLFHAITYLLTVVGLMLLWRTVRTPNGPWSTGAFVGWLLVGWGLFNLVEGIVDHHILQVHHVREDAANQLAWDLAFLVWGAIMLVGGWQLARSPRAQQQESLETGSPVARPQRDLQDR